MINSRKITDLHPKVAAMCQELIARCDAAGIDIIVTSTYRDHESQAELYAAGRTKPGRKVTNAKPGRSWHNWRLAFDVVPMRSGKPVWGTTGDDLVLWKTIGKIGKEIGLEWAGDWVSFKEYPHFQFTGGLSLDDMAAGKTLEG
jgi:peptidoglycan L-alanyl-D-glutamate endopeptidase CwlK